MMLAAKCFGNLGSIKFSYVGTISNNQSITRSMMFPYMISRKYEAVDFEPSNYYFFLFKGGKVEPSSPRNPNYILNVFEKYNSVIALAEQRNNMALEINSKLLQLGNDFKQVGSIVDLDFDYINKEIGFNKLCNYIQITELLFTELDSCLELLTFILYETPHITNEYLSSTESKLRVSGYDSKTKFNEPLFKPLPYVDVQKELSMLTQHYNQIVGVNRKQDCTVETSYRY